MSMAMSSSERPGPRAQQLTRQDCLSVFMRPRGRALPVVAPPAPVIPVLVAARPSRHAAPAIAVARARLGTELDLSDVHGDADGNGDGTAEPHPHEAWPELHLGTPLLPPRPPALPGPSAVRLWVGLATLGCPRPHLPGVGPSALELRPGRGDAAERTR